MRKLCGRQLPISFSLILSERPELGDQMLNVSVCIWGLRGGWRTRRPYHLAFATFPRSALSTGWCRKMGTIGLLARTQDCSVGRRLMSL